ncbi:DEAD-domain-containing protein [Salix suchowensis]|nr:DEAD-domain-containing protein [Salix suchowensis]
MATRSEPLSIESLLQKQKAEKEAAAKPKFLSKEERAKLAIAKRAQEIREQKEREEASQKDRETLEREANELRRKEMGSSNRYGDEDRYAHPERDRGGVMDEGMDGTAIETETGKGKGNSVRLAGRIPTETDTKTCLRSSGGQKQAVGSSPFVFYWNSNSGHTFIHASPASPDTAPQVSIPDSSGSYVPPMTENDLSAIRSRYLGVDKKKRKIRKMNDRKFVFDWDAQDDTLVEDSFVAVGSNRQGAQVMFGRGHLAGWTTAGLRAKEK